MVKIRILPDHVVNRIAAGEVVERPSSVVKELMENSLDAEAHRIDVELIAGGRSLIRVSDDGLGMDEDEALLALERHATSQLREAGDLERITTLGFRGEALPSIAAISRFRLSSSPDAARGGIEISVEGGRILGVEAVARGRGTSIEVRDLFFNTPARRKFLHAPETELRHVQEGVMAIGMSRPDVALSLKHGGRMLLEAPPAHEISQRFRDLLKRRKPGEIYRFEAEGGGYRAEGLLARTGGSGRPHLIFLVNGRWVRDRLLVAAVYRVLRSAGQGYAGSHIVLELSVPPDAVDVNVHPAKAEVRFARSGAVFALVERALRRLLESGHGAVPVRKLDGAGDLQAMAEGSSGGVYGRQSPSGGMFRHPFYAADSGEDRSPGSRGTDSELPVAELSPSLRLAQPGPAARSGARAGTPDTPFGRLLSQYRNSFILLEDDYGLVIVDQHVAHERILYEKFLKRLSGRDAPSQGLLIPRLMEVGEAMAGALDRVVPLCRKVGLELELFGPETIRILSVPPELGDEEVEDFISEILERATALDGSAEMIAERLQEETAASLSCRAAIKVNHRLNEESQRGLLEDLAKTEDPYRCPHGRPIILRLGQDEMERRLGRR